MRSATGAPTTRRSQFAHPAVVVTLAADGAVSRVLSGLTLTGDDLRLALVDTADGKIGTVVDRLRLLCYGYDPAQGIYTPAIMSILRVGGVLTVLLLAAAFFGLRTLGRRRAEKEAAA